MTMSCKFLLLRVETEEIVMLTVGAGTLRHILYLDRNSHRQIQSTGYRTFVGLCSSKNYTNTL